MTLIKVKFRTPSVAGREGSICYQITRERIQRQFPAGYRVFPEEWDKKRSIVVAVSKEREQYIMKVRECIRHDVERLMRIVRHFDNTRACYSADDVAEEYMRQLEEYSLFNYMECLISAHRLNGRIRTSETYRSALSSFRRFRGGEDIMLDCICPEIMEAYAAWLKGQGLIPNTVSFYARILRAAYNRAVERGIVDNSFPFRHVYTGVDKTVKRALPLQKIRRIKNLDLSLLPSLDYARNMFIMSFMLRGMSFIDMAFLRKTDLVNGYIRYRRRKTGQLLMIKWTREMQELLKKYPDNKSEYLLPIIRERGSNERCVYRNVCYNINRGLKKIAEMVDAELPLTLYVARHSWASAAKAKGIPLSVISEGLGHDSEATTQIYLASLETSVVDRANSLIISAI